MRTKTLSEEARQARNAYGREYRRKHPEKVREYNRNYWEKKAQGLQPETLEQTRSGNFPERK